ncbi:hypothetical protein BJX96DRAFT_125029 [Aspergillus floccosus]
MRDYSILPAPLMDIVKRQYQPSPVPETQVDVPRHNHTTIDVNWTSHAVNSGTLAIRTDRPPGDEEKATKNPRTPVRFQKDVEIFKFKQCQGFPLATDRS